MGTAAEHLLRGLDEAGVEYIFGVPGGGTMVIYSATSAFPRLKPMLVRHEFEAAVMADAYARASGRVAAVIGQGAYVGAYACGGLMEALTSSSPVIVVGDTSDNGMSPMPIPQAVTGEFGSPNLVGLLHSVTKCTSLATTAKEVAVGIQLVIKQALAVNPGPAALVIRSEAIVGEVDMNRPPFPHSGSGYLVGPHPRADQESVELAVEMLSRAERPVLFVGKGVHDASAHDALRELAEFWSIPVVTSYKGKSGLEETHPLSMGMVGTYGRPSANAIVAESDMVLVVGAKLSSADTAAGSLFKHGPKVVQIDHSPQNAGWSVAPDLALIGDAREVLSQILAASESVSSSRKRSDLLADLDRRRQEDPVLNDPASLTDSKPVMPQRLIRLLEENLDPDSNVVFDSGFNRVWMSLFYRPSRAGSVFAPGGMSGMGWGLPAALGVKVARPDQPAVTVAGDGGFMMSIHALATAVENDLPVVCVVMNDSSLGMVRHHQSIPVASEFGATDYAAIASGFGAVGYRVEDSQELPQVIKAAQANEEVAVIDVVIDRDATPDKYRESARVATET